MTPEDFKSLPIGTELLVRVTKASSTIDQDGDARVTQHYGSCKAAVSWAHTSSIVGVIAKPAPNPFKVGDIAWVPGHGTPRTILHIHEGVAFCKYGQVSTQTHSLKGLYRTEAEAKATYQS